MRPVSCKPSHTTNQHAVGQPTLGTDSLWPKASVHRSLGQHPRIGAPATIFCPKAIFIYVDSSWRDNGGFWLVERQAWSGRVWGDTGPWNRSQDNRLHSEDNPRPLANRKAKTLASLRKLQPAPAKVRLPRFAALAFVSAEDVQYELSGAARNGVLLREKPADGDRPEQKGKLDPLVNFGHYPPSPTRTHRVL